MESKEIIKGILIEGTPAEKRELFRFTVEDSDDKIFKKFRWFARSSYPRFFEAKDSPEHEITVRNYIKSYRGDCNGIEIAFRGFGKTSLLKLFIVFVILNDEGKHRKYMKILSKDGRNSKQMVTDIYNLIIELQGVYGDIFQKKGDKKREETMGSFTTEDGLKLSSGTVGQTQRGHVQDAYRPDWVIFEDVEDDQTISSIAITERIINKADEAIQGLSFEGTYQVNANYISDAGVVQWFLNQPNINTHIVPIIKGSTPTWDRYTIEKIEELKAGAKDWAGDYLCDPTRAGNKFFDVEQVNADLANAKEPIETSADIRYWDTYKENHRYGIGEDLSDGIGQDSCAMALFDFTTGELVASADDNETAPDLFTYEAVRLGREFGNCIIAPETNNTCGGIAIRVLKEKEYPNIYQKEIRDKVNNVLSTKLGWHTNSKTKPDMFYEFRKDYNDGLIKIYDSRVLREMKSFTKSDLQDARTSAVTRHFDLLTSTCISWQMRKHAQHSGDVKRFYENLGNRPTTNKARR